MNYGQSEAMQGAGQTAFVGGGSLGMPIPQATRNGGSVGASVERANKQSELLLSVISQLEERISPIVAPQPPMPADARGMDKPQSSTTMASALESINDRVQSAILRIQSLASRVEL